MKHRPRIELPDKRDDELPLRSLIATTVACALAGLSVAYAISDRRVDAAPAAAAPDLPAALEPIAEPAVPDPVPAPKEQVSTTLDVPVADAATIEPDSAPEGDDAHEVAASSETPESRLRIEPSFFAYLRCEGLRQRKGRYPCPRDLALEERMREIAKGLPSCREAGAISRGMFDVRLELGPDGAVTDLHVKAPKEAADRAVRACAGAAFRKLQTRLRPKRMIVSMRFKAR